MADESTAAAAPAKGGGLKIFLVILIVILLGGAATAWFLLKPTPPVVLTPIVWPGGGGGEGEGSAEPLKLTATLSDGSYHLLADIRFETAPVDLTAHGAEVHEELAEKKSLIQGILTEVANSMDQTTVHSIKEFKKRLLARLNEKLESVEIEDISVENWLVQPTE
jgi:flagellar basal body-associated protein FliL